MLAARLVRRLNKHEWSLSLAESCTGGLLASSFTDISGASDWFAQGWVTYSNQAKMGSLAVDGNTLEKKGAVSHEVALQMAQGAKRASGTQVSISITGIAGPTGGTENRPVGTVYVAVCIDESFLVRKGEFGGGDRASNKHSFTIFAMQKAIEAWDTHFGRIEQMMHDAELEAADEAARKVALSEALASMNPDLAEWQRQVRWGEEKEVVSTVAEEERDQLALDVDWSSDE